MTTPDPAVRGLRRIGAGLLALGSSLAFFVAVFAIAITAVFATGVVATPLLRDPALPSLSAAAHQGHASSQTWDASDGGRD